MRKNQALAYTVAGLTLCGSMISLALAQHEGHDMQMKDSSPSMQMHKIMMTPMKSMKMTGNTDRDFAMMMAEHHAMAVKMIDIELKHGGGAPVKALARKMREAQVKERKQLLHFAQGH